MKLLEEKAKIAELEAEATLMMEKQKAQQQAKMLQIQGEIARAKARARVYEDYTHIQSRASTKDQEEPDEGIEEKYINRKQRLTTATEELDHRSCDQLATCDKTSEQKMKTVQRKPEIRIEDAEPTADRRGPKQTACNSEGNQEDMVGMMNKLIRQQAAPDVDIDIFSGGRGDIPSKLLPSINPSCNIENSFVEIKLRSKKWLISGSNNPNVSHIQNHTVNLSKNLEFYSSKYENFIVIGDFNAEMTNNYLEEFCASYNLKNLIKEPICFKNIDNPILIDHILTNHPKSFHSSSVYETGLSDFHKLTLTVLKTFHVKHKPEISQYRDFNHFDNTSFSADLR